LLRILPFSVQHAFIQYGFPRRLQTNRRNAPVADTADANGNLGSGVYDIENRLIQPAGTSVTYAYAPGNKRVWRFSQAQF